ncbi:MAG TPA: HIT domain-containing protein [Candidatus Nanoarchaeia archaeon]|nr:HIT domain-containing protein [Candidatus Nanoarchaeia archaeon]
MVSEEEFESMSPEEIAEYQRQSCIFCKIIKGEIPSRKAYEDNKIISVLDINPASKGHLLIMTKEHYPILPVIPIDTAAHMFRITKYLANALKSGVVTGKVTVFIANGAVAGQQSPHFLYHLIPREDNDGLDNFNIPANDFSDEELKKHLAVFKGKIGLMMREYKTRRKIGVGSGAKPEEKPAAGYKDLAELIEKNPQIKDMIINTPEAFKRWLENNAKLKKMFVGVNIDKLSMALKQLKK